MRISDVKLRALIVVYEYNENDFRYQLAADLQDARAEIERLKKQIDALERTSK